MWQNNKWIITPVIINSSCKHRPTLKSTEHAVWSFWVIQDFRILDFIYLAYFSFTLKVSAHSDIFVKNLIHLYSFFCNAEFQFFFMSLFLAREHPFESLELKHFIIVFTRQSHNQTAISCTGIGYRKYVCICACVFVHIWVWICLFMCVPCLLTCEWMCLHLYVSVSTCASVTVCNHTVFIESQTGNKVPFHSFHVRFEWTWNM